MYLAGKLERIANIINGAFVLVIGIILGWMLMGCSVVDPTPVRDDRPEGPTIHLVTFGDQALMSQYADAGAVWSPLGFDTVLTTADEDMGLVECNMFWYQQGQTDCQIRIMIERSPIVLERMGTAAFTKRAERHVFIDTSVTNSYDLVVATAHEIGHIILNTDLHTNGGVMGGSSSELLTVDFDLACRTINVCVEH